jgi:hypothetical protein
MANESHDPTRFGYTLEQWERAVDAGVRILKDVAGIRDNLISYTDLCERIYALSDVRVIPGEYALPYVLGDISRVTLESDGCAISALVVYKDSTDAGRGLYALAIQEGFLPKTPSENQEDQFRFKHMNKAYETWPRQRHRPGERFKRP